MAFKFHRLLLLSLLITSFSSFVRSQCVGDFEIATSTGETVVNICLGNASPIVRVAADIRGFPIMYVLTDDNGVILSSGTYPVFNFASAPAGVCRIYAATFKGRILNTDGEQLGDAVLTSFCYELSSNYVTVIRGSADESTINTIDGITDTTFCSQDGQDDILIFEHTNTANEYIFVITDENGEILALTDSLANFEGAPAGTCYVYGLNYDGDLLAQPGLTVNDALALGCYLLSDNRISVTRVTTAAGDITTDDGLTQKLICVGDSIADVLTFISPGADTSANYSYVITDANDTILSIPSGSSVDFEGAGIGICRVYGVATTGNLIASPGMYFGDIRSDGACLGVTAGFVEVVRTFPTEGRIQTMQGDTLVYTCPDDSIADIVTVNLLSSPSPTIFIITDADDTVLGLSTNQAIDFEGAGEGICFIWRATYVDNLTIQIGDNLFIDDVSDGCYAISDNAVEVRRATPDAGEIASAGGLTSFNLCVGDGMADRFTFDAEYSASTEFILVVTNDSNQVLTIVTASDTIDFEGAGAGTCRVFGLSYHGNLLVTAGTNLLVDVLSDACFDLSDNYVEFVRNNVDPGVLYTQLGTTIYTCPGDGNPDELYLIRQTDADTSITFITDDNGVVLALVDSDTVDFEGAGEGVCLIWAMSFEGSALVEVGDTISGQPLATGCFSLTDPVTVIRRVPTTDNLATIDQETQVEFCTDDGNPDLLILTYAPSSNFPVEYVITDTAGMILGVVSSDTINFEGVPTGVCRVYAVAYTGLFTGMAGENIATADLSDDCFGISDNFVLVIRSQPEGGLVSLPNGESNQYICPGDGNPDIVHFVNSGVAGDAFTYVITNDTNIILGIPPADSADFDTAPRGTCRVWGVAYSGNFLGQVGDMITGVSLSDECFDLSDNFITIIRDTAEAGSITTNMGLTEISVITGDTIPDNYTMVAHGASNAQSKFVATTGSDIILAILPDSTVDFGSVPAGTYKLYHISYTGNLIVSAGFNLAIEPISDDCYDLSSNFINVTVTESFEGGNEGHISLDNLMGQTEEQSLNVYPNPASNLLRFTQNYTATEAILVNAIGGVVKSQEITANRETLMEIGELPDGLYLLLIKNGNELIDQKQILILK